MAHRTIRGFTLIELLVVIAIIGILSAVVLASLNSARTKGADASVKKTMAGTRAQGELYYYANGNSYLGACGTVAAGSVKPVGPQATGAARAAGVTLNVNPVGGGSNTTATCNASATGWAAEVPLRNSPPANPMFCTDYTGKATTTAGTTLTAGKVTCG